MHDSSKYIFDLCVWLKASDVDHGCLQLLDRTSAYAQPFMLQLLRLTEEAGGEQHDARKDAVKLRVRVVQMAGDQL